MDKEKIKEAFKKAKQDIDFLSNEMLEIKKEIYEIKQLLQQKQVFHSNQKTSTLRHINTTDNVTSTHNTTVPQEIEGLKYPNLGISIGNQGASTDRQTDTSTDTSTHNLSEIPPKTQDLDSDKDIETNIQQASEILDSLDALKKEIRLKFKRITQQEMLVFSTIYQLEEQGIEPNYKGIALKLGLSESSIRDYVQRMINKGIPIKKQKINNKKLVLSISQELKKIASLSTIIKLREL
tara:strand:- start:572 stop:1282 length:711 start_codon:yes stop_codon:yes gene_type:complete